MRKNKGQHQLSLIFSSKKEGPVGDSTRNYSLTPLDPGRSGTSVTSVG